MTPAREELYLSPASISLAWNEPEKNLKQVEETVRASLAQFPSIPSESRLFLFPELTLTGFVTQNPPAFGVSPAHPMVQRLCALAGKARAGLAVGLPEANPRDLKRPYNALILIGPDGKIAATYRKMHLFTVGKNPESASYSAGEAGKTCVYRGWKIGFSICFDIRFSGLFHQYARSGVDLVLTASCWIGGPHKSEQYRTLNSANAILMQAYVAAVNQSGRDPYYEYDGAQYVFSPFGENVYNGEPRRLDPAELESCRKLAVRVADRPSYRVAAEPSAS